MANIAYELAIRFGTVVWLHSQSKKHHPDSPEGLMATERNTPLADLNLPDGRPIYWLHAVSMGEVGVAKVLVAELKTQAPDSLIVLSTSTATGIEAAKKIDGVDAVVAARFDIRDLVSTMFASIKPTAIVLVEGDLWRNMLAIARRRGVPVFIANAKMKVRSERFYQQFPLYARSLFSRIERVYAQTELYRERYERSGLPTDRCVVAGNVKLDVSAPAVSTDELASIAKMAGISRDRAVGPASSERTTRGAAPIVTFGSLHPGEEIVALRGMQRVWRKHPNAHAIIAPRHIEKTALFADSIRHEFGIEPIVYSRREATPGALPKSLDGQGSPRPSPSRVTIVDKMGMLMKLYALADVGVVGGTFVSGIGGHNVTEPAFYGKPVLYGPHVYTQLGLHDLITAYDAGQQVSAEAFPEALWAMVDDVDAAWRMGANGLQMVEASRGVAKRIVEDILVRTHAL